MNKFMVLVMTSMLAGTAFCTVSTRLALDTRKGMRNAGAMESIRFSPAWETDVSGATAAVLLDGVAVTNATCDGVFEWTPTRNGIYSFTHSVSVGGSPVGETLGATFVVEGKVVPAVTVTTRLALDTRKGTRKTAATESIRFFARVGDRRCGRDGGGSA